MRHIHVSEVNGKPSVCFDTGLDPRSFARTKMSQCLIEHGYIVYPDGTNKIWKASGVNEINGYMRVLGSPFFGERLDQFLNELTPATQQPALQAVVYWMRAKMLFGDTHSALNPGAAFISCADNDEPENPKGSVFFAPESLSQRCLLVEGVKIDPYNCPDLKGINAAAFCAGVMLYKILSLASPYDNINNIYQDMREGVFLPPQFAIPGLKKNLCDLINNALLLPVANKNINLNGADILSSLLNILMLKNGEAVDISTLFEKVSLEEEQKFQKEKNRYIYKQKTIINTRRFMTSHKPIVIGAIFALFFIVFIAANTTKSRMSRPTTAGMSPETVVREYYDAFSRLNHTYMESIIYRADRTDINVAVNFFAVTRIRQVNEGPTRPRIFTASAWLEQGRELPAPDVFGVTDLKILQTGGSEDSGQIEFLADYILWYPNDLPESYRSDELTLRRLRGNWRITEINRTIKNN